MFDCGGKGPAEGQTEILAKGMRDILIFRKLPSGGKLVLTWVTDAEEEPVRTRRRRAWVYAKKASISNTFE